LYNHNEKYHGLIDEAQNTAVLLRKPRYRDSIGATCPVHCPTRWIYDFEIVKFIRNHRDPITLILEGDSVPFNDEFMMLGKLLETIFVHMKLFESDKAAI
jgi:hypothetical protein